VQADTRHQQLKQSRFDAVGVVVVVVVVVVVAVAVITTSGTYMTIARYIT
jgi:hypothetical protein